MFNNLRKQYNILCTPAQLYVFLSLIAIVTMLIQNMSEPNKYCVGRYSCYLNFNNLLLFGAKLLYVLLWTIILDSLCKNGYTELSWAIVLLPFIMMFVMVGVFLFSQMNM
jgi:hypothetical protein